MNFRRLAKGLTPPFLASVARKIAGTNLQETSICNQLEIRPGIHLRLHPESVGPMRMFVDRDAEMIQELDNFLQLSADRRQLLDIGALHGAFSLTFTARNPSTSALAVDASPYAFARLLYNVHANPQCRIATEECGISDTAGQLKMGFEWEHAVAFSASPCSITIDAFTGDEICRKHGFNPDAIKIDIEGHELAALQGLQHTLKEKRPLIFLEIHPARIALNGGSLTELYEIINGFSYRVHSLENTVLSKSEFCHRTEDFRTSLQPL